MNCPYCHQETEDTAAFCTKCGRRIPRCPACGEVITARIRFCTRDGTPIPEEMTRDLPGLEDTVAEPADEPWRAQTPPEQYQQPQEQESEPKKSGGTVGVLIAAIIVVVVIVLAAVLWTNGMLGQSDDENGEENQTSIVEEEAQDDEEQSEDGTEETEDGPEAETEDETDAGETADESDDETEQTEQLDISLTTNSLALYVGMTHQIIGANADQVNWTYSEPDIVEVDGNGQLTALAAGTVVATATGPNGETASVEVTVLALETEETEEPEEQESTENTEDETAEEETSGDYILPDSSSRYLTRSDLTGLTAWQCRLARNEIYARHGMIFEDAEVKAYFESKSWYHGTIAKADFSTDLFNEYEYANIELIVAYEKEMNYNQAN